MEKQNTQIILGEGDLQFFLALFKNYYRAAPAQMGCFGFLVMYFVTKNHQRVAENRKSLISRNKGFKTGLRQSARYLCI